MMTVLDKNNGRGMLTMHSVMILDTTNFTKEALQYVTNHKISNSSFIYYVVEAALTFNVK